MNLHKKLATMLIAASTLLALFYLGDSIYAKEGLFQTFNEQHGYIPHKYYNAYLIIPSLFAYGVFACLYFVLGVFREQKWIRVSIIIWLASKVIVLLIGFLAVRFHNQLSLVNIEFYAAVYTLIPMAYVYFAFLFVRHKSIKGYLLSTAVINLFALLYPRIAGSLYDEYGRAWLLINQVMVMRLAHVPVLLLSIKLYLQSRTPVADPSVASTDPVMLN